MRTTLRRAFITSFAVSCSSLAFGQFNNPWLTVVNDSNRIRNPDGSVAMHVTTDNLERDYAWGDLNQDGWIDLVIVRKQFSWISPNHVPNQLLMNEQGVLVDRTSAYASASDVPGDFGFSTPTVDKDVQITDLDGDGWLDVVTATESPCCLFPAPLKHVTHPRIYRNLGAVGGVWQGLRYEASRIPLIVQIPGGAPIDIHFASVAVGDVTGDGAPDLYFTDYDETFPDVNDRLLVNDGAGNFTDSLETRMNATMLASTKAMASNIVDLNLDGTREVVKAAALTPNGQIFVAYNPPATQGFFGIYQTVHSVVATYHIDVGDLNRDGRADLIVGDDAVDHVRYNLGNDGAGAVVWGNLVPYSYVGGSDDGFVGNIRVVDLDGDQWLDTIHTDIDVELISCARRCHIYRNPGGTPGEQIVLREEAEMLGNSGWKGAVGLTVNDLKGTYDVAPFDIDNDGDIDMVFGRCTGTTVWINQREESAAPAYCFGDNSGAACPCGNASVMGAKAGCLNSLSFGGRLRMVGTPSVSADSLGLLATQVPNGPALFFQGSWAEGVGAGSVFGDGLLCVGGSILRLGVVFAANNASLHPRPGIDPAISLQAGLAAGDARTYQAWYRDADLSFCTSDVFNLTNGLAITWQN